jgi:hypothetical protein
VSVSASNATGLSPSSNTAASPADTADGVTLPASGLTELVSGDTGGTASSSGVSGLSTAQLQGGSLPTGFSSAIWGASLAGYNNSYPYLSALLPPNAVIISGTVANTYGGAGVNDATVVLLDNGTSVGTTISSATGTYEFYAGTGGGDYLAYVETVGASANAFIQNPTSSVSNANLYGGYLTVITSANSYSAVSSGIATALGSNSDLLGTNASFALTNSGNSIGTHRRDGRAVKDLVVGHE